MKARKSDFFKKAVPDRASGHELMKAIQEFNQQKEAGNNPDDVSFQSSTGKKYHLKEIVSINILK